MIEIFMDGVIGFGVVNEVLEGVADRDSILKN